MPRTRLMRRAALPAVVILVGTVAACSKGESVAPAALASGSVSLASSSVGPSSAPASGSGPAATPQPGTVVTAKAAPGKTVKATVTATGKTTVKATITVTAPAAAGDTTTASTAPARTFTTSATPTFTHGGPTTGSATPPATPSTSPAAPAAGSCIVSDSKMVITVVIPAAAAAWTAGADIDLLEDLSGATQTTRYQVYLAAPLTPGETVTVTETANPLLVSCEAVGVVSVIGASSLLLPRA